MDIRPGTIYKNKTWSFLVPCLRGHGHHFVRYFNPILKLAVGIHDSIVDGTPFAEDRSIFVLVDTLYKPKKFEEFQAWIVNQDFYITDYAVDANIANSRQKMFVLKVPSEYDKTYDAFLGGRYSEMYSPEQIGTLFTTGRRTLVSQILSKSADIKEDFVKKANKTFNTDLTLKQFEEDLKEFELPLSRTEEIFNCSESERKFVSRILDKPQLSLI